jgi:hypothetical protein
MRVPSANPVGQIFPHSFSLINAQQGIIADLYHRDDQIEAIIVAADPVRPVTISSGDKETKLPPAAFTVTPVELVYP